MKSKNIEETLELAIQNHKEDNIAVPKYLLMKKVEREKGIEPST